MSMKQVFVYSIIASFFVFVHVQASNTKDLTVEKYLGRWYLIAVLGHGDVVTSCDRFDIMPGNGGKNRFNEIYKSGRDEDQFEMNMRGKIENSTLSLEYPILRRSLQAEYTYESINKGQELIIIEKSRQADIQLVSRNTIASHEAKERFQHLVSTREEAFFEIDHRGCPHDHN